VTEPPSLAVRRDAEGGARKIFPAMSDTDEADERFARALISAGWSGPVQLRLAVMKLAKEIRRDHGERCAALIEAKHPEAAAEIRQRLLK
jgi:hypothetical protein